MSSRSAQCVPMTQIAGRPSLDSTNPCCHVLLTTTSFGGHERMLLEWLKEASRQRGLAIRIHCRNIPDLVRECASAGFSVDAFSYATPERRRRIASIFRDLAATSGILRKMRGDPIALFAPGVVQTGLGHVLLAAVCRRRVACYVPMAYASRDMRFRYAVVRDWVARRVVRHVDIWITITGQQRQLLKALWRVEAPVYTVANRLRLLDEAVAIAPGKKQGGLLRVLFLGRFDQNQKGLDWLVAELRRHRPLWVGCMRFVFQGQGEYEQALRQLALELKDDLVSVAPWGDGTQAIQQADVLLLPSRFEGFPLVAIEATHCGVPVVASNQSGLADVLPTECLFPFGDFEAMISSIGHMRDARARVSAVAHARARMQVLLSKEGFEQGVEGIIREFAGGISGTRGPAAAP